MIVLTPALAFKWYYSKVSQNLNDWSGNNTAESDSICDCRHKLRETLGRGVGHHLARMQTIELGKPGLDEFV